jgi:hypothetical protein
MNTATPLAFLALVLAADPSRAVSDPDHDLLASFAGDARVAAFDLLSADVSFDAGADSFVLHARTAGPIAEAANAAYVFGFNRGGATGTPFAAIGVPGVSFDTTVLLRANGTGTVAGIPLVAHIEENELFATVSASLLPSTGFAPANFTWAVWSIDTALTGLLRNADFAPVENVRVAAVPEPGAYALLLAGLGVIGGLGRRRWRGRA